MGRQDFLAVETTATGPEIDNLTQSNVSGNTHLHSPTWFPVPPSTGGYQYGIAGETPQWCQTVDGLIYFRGMVYKGSATAGVITNIGNWPAAYATAYGTVASSVNTFKVNGAVTSPAGFPNFLNAEVSFGTVGQFVSDYVDLAGYYHRIDPVTARRDSVPESTGRQRFLEVATLGTPSQMSELVSANPDATTPHRHVVGSIPLTPLSGWDPTATALPLLYRMQDGSLYMAGQVNALSGGAPTSNHLFNLPAGSQYIPAYETRLPVHILEVGFINGTGTVRIQLDGEVWFEPYSAGPTFPDVAVAIDFGIRWWPA